MTSVVSVTTGSNAKRRCHQCGARYEYARSTSRYCSTRCRVAAMRRRQKRSVHFRSASDDWATPPTLFEQLDAEFHFTLDVCASPGNAKCERYFTRERDGLAQTWSGVCWMNPPYGRAIGAWMRKALESSLEGATVVCLVPARTDTRWWHEYATRGEVRYLQGRLKFGAASNSAPFPSAVVVFRPAARQSAGEGPERARTVPDDPEAVEASP